MLWSVLVTLFFFFSKRLESQIAWSDFISSTQQTTIFCLSALLYPNSIRSADKPTALTASEKVLLSSSCLKQNLFANKQGIVNCVPSETLLSTVRELLQFVCLNAIKHSKTCHNKPLNCHCALLRETPEVIGGSVHFLLADQGSVLLSGVSGCQCWDGAWAPAWLCCFRAAFTSSADASSLSFHVFHILCCLGV